MTANLSIYVPAASALTAAQLQQLAPQAQVTQRGQQGDHAAAQYRLTWEGLSITVSVMVPGRIAEHLRGFKGYIMQLAGGQPDDYVQGILGQIDSVQQVFGVVAEPNWHAHVGPLVLGIVSQLNGFFFVNNAVYNAQGQLLIGPPHARPQFFYDPPPETPAALNRKARSERILQQEGVPLNAMLPVIVDEANVKLRPQGYVALRAMALALVALRAELDEDAKYDHLLAAIEYYRVQDALTPLEELFMFDPDPPEEMRYAFLWRYESCWTLLWALSFVDDLGRPDSLCPARYALNLLESHTPQTFRANARLRPAGILLDELDLTYRYHWAIVDAQLSGGFPPSDLEPGVVYERHYALNWLTSYMDLPWDEVTTDT